MSKVENRQNFSPPDMSIREKYTHVPYGHILPTPPNLGHGKIRSEKNTKTLFFQFRQSKSALKWEMSHTDILRPPPSTSVWFWNGKSKIKITPELGGVGKNCPSGTFLIWELICKKNVFFLKTLFSTVNLKSWRNNEFSRRKFFSRVSRF